MIDSWMEELYSLFLVAVETLGTLYFLDTFLQGRRIGRLPKYRFIILYVCTELGVLSGRLIGWWKIIPILLIYVLFALLFYQIPFWQSFFFSVLNYCLLFIMDYLFFLTLDKKMYQSLQIISSSYRGALMGLLAKASWLVLLLLIRKIWRQREEDYPLTNREWMQLSIIPVISLTAILAMSFSYTNDEQVQMFYMIWAIGIVGINLVVLHLMLEIQEKEKALRVSMLVNQNQENRLAAYADGNKVYEQQLKKMHDYKNQLATIQTLINGEDYRSALDFVEKLTESISVDMSAVNTNHPVVNAVLNQKYRRAKEKNISMSLKLGDLHELNMKEEDIVIVLGNLLDNAISECEKLLESGSESALIFLKLVYEDDKMILSVKNPVREKIEVVDNIVQKEHSSGHGIGLLNVKSVVEHYDGDFAITCDEKEFKAVVIL
ncbi:MAG: GHKL domain-containing protein [Lachnospiraceae bacterium]|nr:GHKL domain-containing protein [Lachnospiraceae bacterium]